MNNKISPSLEDYLENIMLLDKAKNGVRLTDIAEQMNVAKSSVHTAIKHLAERGLLVHEKYGILYLTDEGRELADHVYTRHKSIKLFLEKVLMVSGETAESDACVIEHVLSEETMRKIIEFTKNNLS